MRRTDLALALLLIFSTSGAEAGLFHHRKAEPDVPPQPLVAPNGVVVPDWASRRMRESPVPLFGQSWGRRPWAFPLSSQDTPSARMARADQLGYGAGPIPGYTNGPGIGNIPSAPIGPDGTLPRRRPQPSGFPFSYYYLNGAGN